DLVQEVASASSEQSSGVAQINQAMSRVDQVTQRNASAAEELSATAQQLSTEADALQKMMGFFRIANAEEIVERRPVKPFVHSGARSLALTLEPASSPRRNGGWTAESH